VSEGRTPCLRQFTKGLEAPSFSLFERIFATRRISVAKSRKPVEIACTSVLALSVLEMQNLHSTQYLTARVVIGIGANPDGTALGVYAAEDYDFARNAIHSMIVNSTAIMGWLFKNPQETESLR
jgi:hypothetical protein